MKTKITKIASLIAKSCECDQLSQLLEGLFTPAEIEEIANRIHIVQMLGQGKTQRQIAQELGVGLATVNRGARALQQGHFQTLENLL